MGISFSKNVSNADIDVDRICLAVERSNQLKRKTRIVEGSYTRPKHDVELSLLSGELVLCMAGLYHMMNGWAGSASPINLSDIRIVMPA
ncbi:conserved hypothetical protein [groundwater metagenome]|uniref:Uncharacterized protein n=1 Tax=groundwater metagenome TaxID=717931 RepID=A0A098EDF6_9ZZZZ